MADKKDKKRYSDEMEFPPKTEQPNVYPLSWESHTEKMEEIFKASTKEYWDPDALPWDTFDVESYSWEERESIAYWWTILSVFDASAPPVFAHALIKTYEEHEEDPVRRCFFSVVRDEQNHEIVCGKFITLLLDHPDPLTYEPKTEIGKRCQKNAKWLYFNGGRYWSGYKKAVPKYSLAVLFSSFLMGEIAASSIFYQLANNCSEPIFQECFKKICKDEGRHMAICMSLMERDYPKIDVSDVETITKQIRAGYLFLSGVLFEPPVEFWDIPADFIQNQRDAEEIARNAGFGIPTYDEKKENWKQSMLNLKGVLDKYNIPFPAIPEMGIDGKEITDVDLDDIIPVF